jgi:hypothetical protein
MSPVFESNADVWRAPRPPKTICPTISLCYFVGYGDFENRAVSREFWEFKRGNPSWIQAAAGEGEFKWLWPHLKRKRKKRKEKTKDEEE